MEPETRSEHPRDRSPWSACAAGRARSHPRLVPQPQRDHLHRRLVRAVVLEKDVVSRSHVHPMLPGQPRPVRATRPFHAPAVSTGDSSLSRASRPQQLAQLDEPAIVGSVSIHDEALADAAHQVQRCFAVDSNESPYEQTPFGVALEGPPISPNRPPPACPSANPKQYWQRWCS